MKKHILAIYILSFITSLAVADNLSTAQLKDIAADYSDAILTQNFAKWKRVVLETGDWDRTKFRYDVPKLLLGDVEDFMIKDIDQRKESYDIELIFDSKVGDSFHTKITCYLQVLPNGKIKYDGLLFKHPIPEAMRLCAFAQSEALREGDAGENRSRMELVNFLSEIGAPPFRYDFNASKSDQIKTLKKIQIWLVDEGKEWDQSEPRIPCSESEYKYRKQFLKF